MTTKEFKTKITNDFSWSKIIQWAFTIIISISGAIGGAYTVIGGHNDRLIILETNQGYMMKNQENMVKKIDDINLDFNDVNKKIGTINGNIETIDVKLGFMIGGINSLNKRQ